MRADENANSGLRERDILSQKASAPLSRCETNSIVNTEAPSALRGAAFLHYNCITELVRLEKTLTPLSPTTNLTVPDPSLNYVPKSPVYISCYKPKK